jgi:maltose-binding protein MalE
MVPNWRRKIWLGLAGVMLMTACTTNSGVTTTVTDGTTATTIPAPGTSQVEPTKLLVWVDETRRPVVEAAAERFQATSGIVVEVEVIPFREIRGSVLDSVPAGQGPDLFIDSNEDTGALAEAGVIAPLDLAIVEAGFVPVALDAFAYGGEIYAMPFVTEAVGLFYNKDLVAQAPADFEALRSVCDGLGFPAADGMPCLAIPAGEPLHQFPFLAGFGGYLFGFGSRSYDLMDIGIGTPESIAGATFLNDLYRDGYADGAVDYSTMADLFNQGSVPFMWTGPWQVEAVNAAGINYGVARLPVMSGNAARPLVGSQGFFLNAMSGIPESAMSFLLDYIATTETMVQLSVVTGRPPAWLDALAGGSIDPNMAAFGESAADGVPLPNVAELETVWGLLSEAFGALSGSTGDPAAIMATAAGSVREVLGAG